MEQVQVQQLQLQGAVDALKGIIDALVQDKMNLQAQNYILGSQLKDALQETTSLQKQIIDMRKEANESKQSAPISADSSQGTH